MDKIHHIYSKQCFSFMGHTQQGLRDHTLCQRSDPSQLHGEASTLPYPLHSLSSPLTLEPGNNSQGNRHYHHHAIGCNVKAWPKATEPTLGGLNLRSWAVTFLALRGAQRLHNEKQKELHTALRLETLPTQSEFFPFSVFLSLALGPRTPDQAAISFMPCIFAAPLCRLSGPFQPGPLPNTGLHSQPQPHRFSLKAPS